MPAAITHYLLAERIEKQNKEAIKNKNALFWGAQGPDIFFCHRLFPWQVGNTIRAYGTRLHHEKPGRLLESMRRALEQTEPGQFEVVKSYLCGFLCHYSLDRVGHPFVRYGAEMLHKKNPADSVSIYHHQIETILDVILLRYECGMLPVDFNLKKTLPKDTAVQSAIARFYQKVLFLLFSVQESERQLFQMTDDARIAYRRMNDRTMLKKPFLERLEKHTKYGRIVSCHIRSISEEDGYDYANIQGSEWEDAGIIRTDSFFDLFEYSVADAQSLIRGFFAGEDLTQLTKNISFYGEEEK